MGTHLVWFRNDLRVTDNTALFKACEDPDAKIIALYIATPQQWQEHAVSERQAACLFDNLSALKQELTKCGIPLLYRQCETYTDSVDIVSHICTKHKVDAIFYNRQYQWNEQQRDKLLASRLSDSVSCFACDDNLLLPPLSVLTGSGEMYKIFTPFRNACLKRLLQAETVVLPKPAKRGSSVNSDDLKPFDYPRRAYSDFPGGEKAALARLKHFCLQDVVDYGKNRDFPALDMTSKLSAYLSTGVISIRQCYQRLQLEQPLFWEDKSGGAFVWFSQLIWREFFQNLLIAYPKLSKSRPFIGWTDNVVWNNDPTEFARWQQGMTGYPIVDAAMRQLNQTGWMHNRLRLIVAVFLVKDLLIDWRWGEQYFMSQLIDGDLAANNGGWQWCASTGTDSTPYFRIFNPTRQGQRFDPKGQFIRQWLPELNEVPDKMIHTPHSWAEKQGIILNYPFPIVSHDIARQKALTAFAKAKTVGQ